MQWSSPFSYTFRAVFSDQRPLEVTVPMREFSSHAAAVRAVSRTLLELGKIPLFARSWLRTVMVVRNGRPVAVGDMWRKSMTLSVPWGELSGLWYNLFLREGGVATLRYVHDNVAWKTAQSLDANFVSKRARVAEDDSLVDVSETFVAWMKVRRDPDSPGSRLIKRLVPNKLSVLDDLVCPKFAGACAASRM